MIPNRQTMVAMVTALCGIGISASPASAQSVQGKAGTLTVEFATSSLDSLMLHSSRSNYNQTSLEGFRVQIYSGSGLTSKDEASATQTRFLKMFPGERAYIIYNAPFWRVRVGDFRSRSEAMRMLQSVKPSFAGSYIVRDNTIRKKNFRH